MKETLRYVLYTRKSSEREDRQVQSIDDQTKYWKERAKQEWIEIVQIFTEEKSAKAPWVRKAFYEMCDLIEKWWVDWLLCWKLDRLARNPVDAWSIQYMLQRHKIKKIITSDRLYLPEDSWLIFSVETWMANQYVLDLAKNVKRWLKSKIEKWHFPAKAPQWYINDPILRTIAPDPIKFELVRKMWTLFLTWCYPPSKIAHIANTEWWYSTVDTKYKARVPLAVSTLYNILKNPFYAGYMRYNWQIIKWSHEAMISWEQYEKAQQLISHTNASPNKIQTERPSKLEFAYTWSMRCSHCWCMITGVKKYKNIRSTWQRKEYTYYACTHKKNTPDFRCTQRWCFTEDSIESQIIDLLEQIEIIPEFYIWARDVLKEKFKDENSEQESVIESIENSLESAEKKKNRLLHMRLAWEFDHDHNEYEKLRDTLEKEIELLKIRKTEMKKEVINWTELLWDAINFSECAIKRFKNWDIETKKVIFRSVGWNWILKDWKAETNLQDWFLPFLRYKQFQWVSNITSELNRKEIWISTNADSDLLISIWWAWLELNQRSAEADYEPISIFSFSRPFPGLKYLSRFIASARVSYISLYINFQFLPRRV